MKAYVLIAVSVAVMLCGDPLGDALGTLIEQAYECNHMNAFPMDANRKIYGLPENANEEYHL